MRLPTVLVITAMALTGSVVPANDHVYKADERNNCPQKEDATTQTVPLTTDQPPTSDLDQSPTKNRDNGNDNEVAPSIISGVRLTDWLIVIFTGILTFVTIWQGYLARLALRETKRSADAAYKSVMIARDYAERELRAYLSVEAGHFTMQVPANNVRVEVTPIIYNGGQTPASDVQFYCVAKMLPFHLPPEIDLTIPETGPEESVFTVAAQQRHQGVVFADRIYTDNEVRDMQLLNQRAFYVYGTVTYRDVFGNDWHTNFCYFIRDMFDDTMQWLSIGRHNEAT